MTDLIPLRVSGYFGFLGPLIAVIAIIASILIHPWFEWADNALSDLGAIGTSYNIIFNLGLVLSGVSGFIFSLGIPEIVEEWLGRLGACVLVAAMFTLCLIGIFPSGTSPHMLVSISFFALFALAIFLIGIDQFLEEHTRPWGIFCISILILALTSLGLISRIPYDLGAAIPEVIGITVIAEFSIAFGYRLVSR